MIDRILEIKARLKAAQEAANHPSYDNMTEERGRIWAILSLEKDALPLVAYLLSALESAEKVVEAAKMVRAEYRDHPVCVARQKKGRCLHASYELVIAVDALAAHDAVLVDTKRIK